MQLRSGQVRPHLQGDLTAAAEDALVARHAEAVDHVLREPEGHHLRLLQRQPPVEQAAEVHVHDLPRLRVQQDVLACAEGNHVLLLHCVTAIVCP